MLKYKIVGESFALLAGKGEAGENGFLTLGFPADVPIVSAKVNGCSYPTIGTTLRVPVTAFAVGVNRIALRLADGKTVPAEGIRLTGGLFVPEGAKIEDVVSALDKRLAAFGTALEKLSARLGALEEESGILP